MYRVAYYASGSYKVVFKEFESLKETFQFTQSLPLDSVLEIRYYENSDNNRPTF